MYLEYISFIKIFSANCYIKLYAEKCCKRTGLIIKAQHKRRIVKYLKSKILPNKKIGYLAIIYKKSDIFLD